MDFIFHTLFVYTVTRGNGKAILGSILIDSLYFVHPFFSLIGQNGWAEYILTWGSRFHSIFLFPILFLVLGLFDSRALAVAAGCIIHIGIDLTCHATEGSRYLYPLIDANVPSGFFTWTDPPMIVLSICASIIMILLNIYVIK